MAMIEEVRRRQGEVDCCHELERKQLGRKALGGGLTAGRQGDIEGDDDGLVTLR